MFWEYLQQWEGRRNSVLLSMTAVVKYDLKTAVTLDILIPEILLVYPHNYDISKFTGIFIRIIFFHIC